MELATDRRTVLQAEIAGKSVAIDFTRGEESYCKETIKKPAAGLQNESMKVKPKSIVPFRTLEISLRIRESECTKVSSPLLDPAFRQTNDGSVLSFWMTNN